MINDIREKINIQLIMKILTFVMAINVVTPIPFVTGSQYYWIIVFLTICLNVFLLIKYKKEYFKVNFWNLIFIISCLISSFLNFEFKNIYSIVLIITTALTMLNMMPSQNITYKSFIFEKHLIYNLIVYYTFILGLLSIILSVINNSKEFLDLITGSRYLGIYNNSNQLAFWAFISFMFSYYDYSNRKLFNSCNILLQLFLIIISGCRSVLVVLFVVFFYFISSKIRDKNKLFRYLVIVILLFLLFLVVISFIRYRWLFRNLNEFKIEDIINTLTGLRYYIWKDAITIFTKKPIFGVGVNNLNAAAQKYLASDSYYLLGSWEDPHNFIISLLCYTGIVGCIIFLKIIYDLIKSAIVLNLNFELLFIISMLIIGLLDIGIIFDGRILSITFWYIFGIIKSEKKLRETV